MRISFNIKSKGIYNSGWTNSKYEQNKNNKFDKNDRKVSFDRNDINKYRKNGKWK